jgi:molecular chaperone DnaK (HSP70)
MEVRPTYGLSETDVARMVDDSFTYAEADVEARLLIEARNEADTVSTHVERALRQGGALVSPEERADIVRTLAGLKAARDTSDRGGIQDATIALNKATEHLAELMMDSALKGALGTERAREIMGSS